jgi:hypothetical protein
MSIVMSVGRSQQNVPPQAGKRCKLELAGRLRSSTLGCLTASLLCLASWGCSAPAGVNPPGGESGVAVDLGGPTVRAKIHDDLPEFSFTLRGEAEPDLEIFHAEKIEIRRGTEAQPVQVIEGLETETPVSSDFLGLEVLDMNFDGYGDLRIIQFRSAGPNTPYLNWLFDPATARFVSSAELDAITSPTFDPETGSIRSEWRDGAASYGTDLYAVLGGKPVLVRKERKEYSDSGVYRWTVSEWVDGEWKILEDKEVRE